MIKAGNLLNRDFQRKILGDLCTVGRIILWGLIVSPWLSPEVLACSK